MSKTRTAAERYNKRLHAIFDEARRLERTPLPPETPILVTRKATGETMRLTVRYGEVYAATNERVTERRHLLTAWGNASPELQFNTVADVGRDAPNV